MHWDERHSQQRKLYEMVSTYVSKSYNKALRNRGKNMWVIFLLIMMQRLVTSSTTAVRQSLQKRIHILEEQAFRFKTMTEAEFAEIDLEENMEEAINKAKEFKNGNNTNDSEDIPVNNNNNKSDTTNRGTDKEEKNNTN